MKSDETPPSKVLALTDEIARLSAALRKIQRSANDSHPTAIWMQKVAAHALHPQQWPEQPEESPSDRAALFDEIAKTGEALHAAEAASPPTTVWVRKPGH